MKNTILLLSFIACTLIACSPNTSSDNNPDDATNTNPIPSEKPQSEDEEWIEYWTTFQAAAASKDFAKLKEMVHFSEVFTKKEFDDYIDVYLSEEVTALITKTEANTMPLKDDTGHGDDVREFSWYESSYDEEEGIEYESGLYFYFKKIENQYKLFALLAAG